MAETIRCPTCKREIPPAAQSSQWRPFCSPRCRSVDFGSWLTESYRVPATSDDETEDPHPPADREDEGS